MRHDHFGNALPGQLADTFYQPLPSSGPVWWSSWKLLGNLVCAVLLFGAILGGLVL